MDHFVPPFVMNSFTVDEYSRYDLALNHLPPDFNSPNVCYDFMHIEDP